jgi:hypothetical protein
LVTDATTEVEDLTPDTSTSETPPEEASTEELIPPVDGEETLDAENATEEAVPRLPSDYSLKELEVLYHAGQLTDPALVQQRDRHIQSQSDIQRNEQANLQRLQFEEEQRGKQFEQARIDRDEVLSANAERLTVGADPALIQESNQVALDKYDAQSQAIHTAPIDRAVSSALLMVLGDNTTTRQQLKAMTIADKTTALFQAGWNAREAQYGAVADQATAATKKVADDKKAAEAPADVAAPRKAKGTGATGPTYEAIQKMSESERTALAETPQERIKIMDAAKARARAAGRL